MATETTKQGAAFVRAEGVAIRSSVPHLCKYLVLNRPEFRDRVWGMGETTLVAAANWLSEGARTNRLSYLTLRSMSQDRIEILAEEYCARYLDDRIIETGLEVIEEARGRSLQLVLVSDLIEPAANYLAKRLGGVDHVIANRLEYVRGLATGRVLDPVVGEHDGDAIIAEFARRHDIDLRHSITYARPGSAATFLVRWPTFEQRE